MTVFGTFWRKRPLMEWWQDILFFTILCVAIPTLWVVVRIDDFFNNRNSK